MIVEKYMGVKAMFDSSSTSNRGVLRSETYLRPEQHPEEPLHRETELEIIASTLQPLTRREPAHLLVYGPAGVGKTTTIAHTLDQLESETRVKPIRINCWQYNTRSSLLTELLIQLGYPAPRKGKPVDELLSRIQEWVDKNRTVALALDEFDQLEDKGAVLYNLYVINRKIDNSIGTILVSNCPPADLELDPRTESRIGCDGIEFTPYRKEELEIILQDRAEQAFYPGSVPEEVISKIASTVADRSGDCRQALSHLLEAGRTAEWRNESEITSEILKQIL